MPGRDPRRAARGILRRRRRPIAAGLAGLGVLLALTSLQGAADPVASDDDRDPRGHVGSGDVIVPVLLASGAVAAALSVGDVVDVLGLSDASPPEPTVIAREARVYEIPASAAFAGSSSAVVLMVVPESEAVPLSAASLGGGVSVILHGR